MRLKEVKFLINLWGKIFIDFSFYFLSCILGLGLIHINFAGKTVLHSNTSITNDVKYCWNSFMCQINSQKLFLFKSVQMGPSSKLVLMVNLRPERIE